MEKKAKRLTKRQLAALKATAETRHRADLEAATGIVGWRLATVLLHILAAKGVLSRDEGEAVILSAHRGVWPDLPNSRIADTMLELDLVEWQREISARH